MPPLAVAEGDQSPLLAQALQGVAGLPLGQADALERVCEHWVSGTWRCREQVDNGDPTDSHCTCTAARAV